MPSISLRLWSKTDGRRICTSCSWSAPNILSPSSWIPNQSDTVQTSRITITIFIATAEIRLRSSWPTASITERCHYLWSPTAFGRKCVPNATEKCTRWCYLCGHWAKSNHRHFATIGKCTHPANKRIHTTTASVLSAVGANLVSWIDLYLLFNSPFLYMRTPHACMWLY